MATLDEIVEYSLYTEVRKLRDNISLVMDPASGKLYVKKRLDVFSVPVFEYLKSKNDIHIPRVKGFWEEEEKLVVLEEYIQGVTLEEMLESKKDYKGRPLEFDEMKRILLEICEGLIFLHAATPPIIHRDIKASNVIITDDGMVKIIDYDAAKTYVKGKNKDTVLIGTQGIAAPEQYGFAQSDERTDIYALGKLMESIFADSKYAESKQVKKIIDKAIMLQPDLRYSSVQEMKSAIEKLKEPSSNNEVNKTVNKTEWIQRGIIIAAALLIISCIIYFSMDSRDSGNDNSSDGQVLDESSEREDSSSDGKTRVDIKVKYLEGLSQTIPSSDEYDMLIVKIDKQNIGEYIEFGKIKLEGMLEGDEEYAVLKNKLHGKGWIFSTEILHEMCNRNSPEAVKAEYRYTFTGDNLEEDMNTYCSYGIGVNITNGTGYNGVDKFEYYGSGAQVPGLRTFEYTGFDDAKGYLVFMSDRLVSCEGTKNKKYDKCTWPQSMIYE